VVVNLGGACNHDDDHQRMATMNCMQHTCAIHWCSTVQTLLQYF
jgi:hypothetical protein